MTGSAGDSGVNPRWSLLAGVVVAALVLVGGNALGRPGLAVAVILVQAALVTGWLVLYRTGLEPVLLVVAALAAADAWVLHSSDVTAGGVAGVLGLSVIGVLFHQLIRQDPRGANAAVAYLLGVIVAGCAPALLLPLRELGDGRSVVYAGVASAAAALVLVRAPGPDLVRRLAALAVAAGVGACFGLPAGGLPVLAALGVGAASGAAALLVDRLCARMTWPQGRGSQPSARALAGFASLLPLLLASPIAYLAGRIIASGSR